MPKIVNKRNNKHYHHDTVGSAFSDKENALTMSSHLLRKQDPDEESTCNILPLRSEVEF